MNRRKRKIMAVLCSVSMLTAIAGSTAGQIFFQPLTAFAADFAEENYVKTSPAEGYAFLTKGNPSSTRERIAAEYDAVFIELYDKMQEQLMNQTLNGIPEDIQIKMKKYENGQQVEYTETKYAFKVTLDLFKYKLSSNGSNSGSSDIRSQLLTFAQNVLEDSPQFYWTDSTNSVRYQAYSTNDVYYSMEFYFMVDPVFYPKINNVDVGRAALDEANTKMNNAVESFAGVIAGKDTVYSKLMAVNNKLVMDTYYDITNGVSGQAAHSQNAYGCLVNKTCVCNGYAKAFELVCNRYGITDTIRITGKLHDAFKNTYVNHAWNACIVGGKWYFIDVTANDPLINTTGRKEYNDPDTYNKYFLIGSTKLCKDHVIEENAVPYPTYEANDFSEPSLPKVTRNGAEYCVISSADDLRVFAGMVDYYSVCPNAILNADIDLGGTEFTPIGNDDHPFSGIFDGNGHSVSRLNVVSSSSSVGLFGTVGKATIKHLTLASGTVKGSGLDEDKACGAFAGRITTDTVIENCDNVGVTVSARTAGGFVGRIDTGSSSSPAGKIINCTNSAAVNGVKYGGGIAGLVRSDKKAVIEGCISEGTVTAENAGSFVGKLESDISLKSSLSLVNKEVYGEKGEAAIEVNKVCVVGFVSSVDGVSFAENTTDGAAAYALGWGQVLGRDSLPDPDKLSSSSKVYRLEYSIESSRYAVYFNRPFDVSLFPSVDLPEGYEWVYKGRPVVPSELAGLAEDITLTAEKLPAYISDRAFMTLGESMSYCWLVGASDELVASVESGGSPLAFGAKINGSYTAVYLNGVKTDNGNKYLEYSMDIPAKNLADSISCEISYTRGGRSYHFVSGERSAADYLRKLANDSSLSDDVRTAAVSILNYASSVQTYKGYNTDSPANSGIAPSLKETAPVAKSDITAADAVFNSGSSDISLRAVTVNMLSKVTMRAYYKLGNAAQTAYQNGFLTFEYTAPDGTSGSKNVGVAAENTGICGREGEFIWVEIPVGISPKNYADQAQIVLRNGSEQGDSLSYSVLNYIAAKCDTTRGMEKVAAALYRYYLAVRTLA